MLEPLIERWRGIDKWPEADATVVSCEVVSEGGYQQPPPSVRITFFYRDATQAIQGGDLVADSATSLFNLCVNDTFQVRFNPKRPSQFYSSEVHSIHTEFRLAFWGCLGILVPAILLISSLRHR